MPRLVLLSDTHGRHDAPVPDGDILVHAGDFSAWGDLREVKEFNDFLGAQPHRRKVVIAGNYDWSFYRRESEARALLTNAFYLQDESAEIDGLKFYGSPWQPERFASIEALRKLYKQPRQRELLQEAINFLKPRGFPWRPNLLNGAFNLPRGAALREKWALIPTDTDVLITHGPPLGIGDLTHGKVNAGCRDLLERVREVKPRLHLFGHIHEGRGVFESPEAPGTLFVNASVGEGGRGKPIVVDLDKKELR
jgi:predicted phosphohydrolase